MSINVYFFALLYSMCNVAGAAIIKNKLFSTSVVDLKSFFVFFLDAKIFFAMLLIFISMFFSIKALSLSQFSSVIPVLTGVNFLFTIFIGLMFFKDSLNFHGYVGIICILVGVYLLGVDK